LRIELSTLEIRHYFTKDEAEAETKTEIKPVDTEEPLNVPKEEPFEKSVTKLNSSTGKRAVIES